MKIVYVFAWCRYINKLWLELAVTKYRDSHDHGELGWRHIMAPQITGISICLGLFSLYIFHITGPLTKGQ